MNESEQLKKNLRSIHKVKWTVSLKRRQQPPDRQRIPLARLAVEETGMGVVEDKVIKNHYAAEYIYNAYRDTKTCGVIEEDKQYGITEIAEPIGVIAAVIPTTNPTSTAIFKTLLALKRATEL